MLNIKPSKMFFSDKWKLYTKQEGWRKTWARFETLLCILKKYCHHSTVEFHDFQIKELIHLILLGSCSRQEQLVVPQRRK